VSANSAPRGDDWLADDIAALQAEGVGIIVSLLTEDEQVALGFAAECDVCVAQGIEFITFPIQDFGVPADGQGFLTLASQLAEQVKAGKSVAVHCRQSIGRSGLLTCAVSVALGSVTEAIDLVSRARGVRVPKGADQHRWLEDNLTR
jgi:protein-tyrosine phosphatase